MTTEKEEPPCTCGVGTMFYSHLHQGSCPFSKADVRPPMTGFTWDEKASSPSSKPSTFEELLDRFKKAILADERDNGIDNGQRAEIDATRSALVSAYKELEAENEIYQQRLFEAIQQADSDTQLYRANALTAEEAAAILAWDGLLAPAILEKLRSISSKRKPE